MQIDNLGNKLMITGNVKSIAHYAELKSSVDEIIKSQNRITIELTDSISLTSSVIGYFSKIVNVDKINLELYVSNDRLFNLLTDLGLIEIFNVKKMK